MTHLFCCTLVVLEHRQDCTLRITLEKSLDRVFAKQEVCLRKKSATL